MTDANIGLKIHSDGKVGIGTDNPNNPLTIHGSGNHIYLKDTATNNIFQIRSAGGVAEFNSFGTGGARRDFVFNQYATEVLRIDSSGDVSIGSATNGGSNRLNVVDSFTDAFVNPTDSILRITNADTSGTTGQASMSFTSQTSGSNADSAIVSQAEDASGNARLEFWTDTNNGMSEKMAITSGGNATLTGTLTQNSSDIRLKTNIQPITNSLEKVKSLSGFTYNWNKTAQDIGFEGEEHDELQVGLSAQDVEKIQPEVVKPAPIDNNFKTIQYEKLVPLLVEAIKEQQEQIEALEAEVAALKSS